WWYSTTVGGIDLKKKSITMGKGCEKVFTMSPNTCLPCPRTVQSVSEACAIAHWYVLLINTTLK
ncbi:MAG: hypothetical protein FT714_19990, partial [Pantoea sp. Pent]|nr:hypothetical protein [Pantoea sp. Pent]